jgi:predicted small lipoprotein YifL
MKKITLSIISILLMMSLSGCGVGSLVALPFKTVGAVANVVAPDAVGDTISSVGDAADAAIPF